MDNVESENVVDLALDYLPREGVSGPKLFQTETTTILTFNAIRKAMSGRYEDAGTAIVEIPHCLATRFGYPNDEARMGHPGYKNGSLGICEVFNSLWLRELKSFNRLRFPNAADWWPKLARRHFRLTFHDSTFECIGDQLTIRATLEPLVKDLQPVLYRMLEEEG